MRPAQSQRVVTRATGTTAAKPVGQSRPAQRSARRLGCTPLVLGRALLGCSASQPVAASRSAGRRRRAPARRAQRAGGAAALID